MNKIRIAILGLGVVGSHVVKLIEKNSYILDNTKCEIVAIGAKNKKKKRIFNVSKYKWINDFKILNQIKPDLIIETVGGTALDKLHHTAFQIMRDTAENHPEGSR